MYHPDQQTKVPNTILQHQKKSVYKRRDSRLGVFKRFKRSQYDIIQTYL